MGATDILADILRLPAEERARLVRELIRSLDGEPDADAAKHGTPRLSVAVPRSITALPIR